MFEEARVKKEWGIGDCEVGEVGSKRQSPKEPREIGAMNRIAIDFQLL